MTSSPYYVTLCIHVNVLTTDIISGILNSNLISFSSPMMQSQSFLKPDAQTQQSAKPCDLILQAATSPSDLFGSKTSTPFEGDPHTPCFKFENQLVDIMEDPFDIVERKAVQFRNNDPFEVVSAAAAAYTSDTVNTTNNSLMNCAFNCTNESSTGLTTDFENLKITSGGVVDCSVQKSPPPQTNAQKG